MSRVTVIVPTHNRANLVVDAIDSLLAQTYDDLRVVVVIDGSTDHTHEAIAHYGGLIATIFQANAGPSAARNRGIRAADSEFIAFLDDDDTVSPTKIERQVAYLDAHPDVDVVYCGWQIIHPDRFTVREEIRPDREGDLLKALLLEGRLFPLHAALLRRDCVEDAGLFDETIPTGEDGEFWIRVARTGHQFGCIPEPLCQYHMTPSRLARDLEKRKEGLANVLHHIFDDPDLPPEIAVLREEVYARRYLELGLDCYAFSVTEADDRLALARDYLSRALSLRPRILEGRLDFLDLVTHRAIELDPVRPELHIRRMMSRLFSAAAHWDWLLSRVLGRLHIVLAFQAYQIGNPAHVVPHVLRAIRYDPTWLGNRGVVSIFVRSLLGRKMQHRLA